MFFRISYHVKSKMFQTPAPPLFQFSRVPTDPS